MMFHIQPWMILSLLPLSTAFEDDSKDSGQNSANTIQLDHKNTNIASHAIRVYQSSPTVSSLTLSELVSAFIDIIGRRLMLTLNGLYVATSEHAFGFQDGNLLCQNLLLLSFGAGLAFMLEMSEFLVVSYASSLTLSVAGIFKEVITLLLAVIVNGDQISTVNIVGLVICLSGIVVHVVLKATVSQDEVKTYRTRGHHEQRQNLLDSEPEDDLELPHITARRKR